MQESISFQERTANSQGAQHGLFELAHLSSNGIWQFVLPKPIPVSAPIDVETIEKDRHGNIRYFRNTFMGTLIDDCLCSGESVQTDITREKHAEQLAASARRKLQHGTDAHPVLFAYIGMDD